MHGTNYQNTLILPSGDCRRLESTRPDRPGTIAAQQYDLISAMPHTLTSDDLLWQIERLRSGSDAAARQGRETYFSTGRACLRASPLVKSWGWAIHHDNNARVALVARSSDTWHDLTNDSRIEKIAGMRSSRK